MTGNRSRLWALGFVAAVLCTALLAAVMAGFEVVARFDRGSHSALHEFGEAHPAWLTAMRIVTHLGDTITVVLVDAAIVIACMLLRRPRAAVFVVVAGATVWAARILVRDLVDRPRPDEAFWQADGPAFPSGHATNSAAMVALAVIAAWPWLRTALARTLAVGAAALLAATVGFSRVAGGVHWPTDVIGGWLLAAALVSVVAALADPHRRGRSDGSNALRSSTT